MEKKHIEKAIIFSNLIVYQNINNFNDLLKWNDALNTIYNLEQAKLPYHINLIDELHADENAHSRIFAQILRYKKDNKYPFYEKFISELCRFSKLNVDSPIIEKVDSCGRIDIPIFDKNYAIIIENKITDLASDQNGSEGGQIARYIETINKYHNKKFEEIYVVYTPKYSREPSYDCWIKKDKTSYESEFKERFKSLSYRDNIYPWLKNEILPSIHITDKFLSSAVEQYIDHLEGIFNLRNIDKHKNMKIQEFIIEELKLPNNNPEEAIKILSDKSEELNNALTQIELLKSRYYKQTMITLFEHWRKLLIADFPNNKIVGDAFKNDKRFINIGIEFSIDNKKFVAIIEWANYAQPTIYFGIGKHFVSDIKHDTPKLLQEILDNNELIKPELFWYGWKHTSLEFAFEKLKDLMEQINEIKTQV